MSLNGWLQRLNNTMEQIPIHTANCKTCTDNYLYFCHNSFQIMHIRRIFLLLFCCLVSLLQASTYSQLMLEEGVRKSLNGYISLYEDAADTATLAHVDTFFRSGKMLSGKSIPEKLVENRCYWLHFAVSNPIRNSLPWMLQFQTPVSSADVYAICTDHSAGKTDTLHTHAESVNNYHKLKVEINPHSGSVTHYYVRLYQHLPMTFTVGRICLVPYAEYMDSFIEQSTMVGFIVGIMFLLLMYHTFMLAVRRKWLYLFYVLYLVFHIGYVLYGSYYVEYVLIDSNQLSYSWMCMSFSIGIFFYTLFIRAFIGKDNMPRSIDKWFYRPYIVFLIISNLGMIFLSVLNNDWFYRFYMLIPIIYSVLGLMIALLLIAWVGNLEIRLVLIGSVITVVSGICATYLDMRSYIDNNHVYNLGMVADVLFYAYAINLKHRHEKKRVQDQQAELLTVRSKIETQQRELTIKALYINQQNHILDELRTHIQAAHDSNPDTQSGTVSLLATLERHIHQSSWDEFERYFIEVHPSFYTTLKVRCPALTQNELRLCALLRLNLNTKQIADITQKTAKSIDVTRSRIRQKLDLQRDDSLYDIISAI